MIDNFANLFGFLTGLLLAAILFPDIDMKGRCRRVLVITVGVDASARVCACVCACGLSCAVELRAVSCGR